MGSRKIGLVFFTIAAVIIIPTLMNFNVFSDAKAAYLFDRISGPSRDIYYSDFLSCFAGIILLDCPEKTSQDTYAFLCRTSTHFPAWPADMGFNKSVRNY